ncbi:MAG: thioredoxin family protein [Helicobacteraceae bacterium]|nr:thioredoxin family protein [Helicobacteraceae bacterium]
MYKIFLILIFVTTSLFAVTDWAEDYKSALKEAKSQQKKVLVYFTKEGCEKCDEMAWTMNSDQDVSEYINTHFVAVALDLDYDRRQGLKVYSAPTIYFINFNEKQIGDPVIGALGPKTFLLKLNEVENTK